MDITFAEDDNVQYTVEGVIKHKTNRGNTELLIKW